MPRSSINFSTIRPTFLRSATSKTSANVPADMTSSVACRRARPHSSDCVSPSTKAMSAEVSMAIMGARPYRQIYNGSPSSPYRESWILAASGPGVACAIAARRAASRICHLWSGSNAGLLTATRRTAGWPCRVSTTSSPDSARRTRSVSWAFASLTEISTLASRGTTDYSALYWTNVWSNSSRNLLQKIAQQRHQRLVGRWHRVIGQLVWLHPGQRLAFPRGDETLPAAAQEQRH